MAGIVGFLLATVLFVWQFCARPAVPSQYTITLGELTQTFTLGSKLEIGYMEFPVAVKITHDSKILAQITNGAINSGLGSLDNSTLLITPHYKLQWGWLWQNLGSAQAKLTENGSDIAIDLSNVPMPTILDTTKTIGSTEQNLDAFYEGIFVDAAQLGAAKANAYQKADSMAVLKFGQTLSLQEIKNLRACSLTLFYSLKNSLKLTKKNLKELKLTLRGGAKGLQGRVTDKGFEIVGGLH